MSRILIIFAHPSQQSYNTSILHKSVEGLGEKGHAIQISDLYAQRFDPAMTEEELYRKNTPDSILREQEKVVWSNTLFFIFPIWWWSPPAILKGWLERVLCLDFAFKYDIKRSSYVGTLQDRKAAIISTGSSDPASYPVAWQTASHTSYVGDILAVSGVTVIKHMILYNIHQYQSRSELEQHLSDVYDFSRSL
ncbi:MAG: NAD(P)H-dependent oxidoreductase [Roseiflexaceae bacterium]